MLLVRFVGILGRGGHVDRRRAAAVDHDHGTHDGNAGGVDFDEAAWAINGNKLVHIDGDLGGVQGQAAGRFQAILPLYLFRATTFDVNGAISIDEQARIALYMQIVMLLDVRFAIIADLP